MYKASEKDGCEIYKNIQICIKYDRKN